MISFILPQRLLLWKHIEMDPQSFNELVRSRRSVFPDQFEPGAPVDDMIVRQVLTNATWAPNHGRMEPWHFTVFTGAGLRKLATFQADMYRKSAGEKFKEITWSKLMKNPLKASHVVAIGMKRTTAKNIPEVEDIAAVACAVQNIYLSVTAYGLGGYWTTGGVTYIDEAKSFFGLGEADRLMGFFYIGKIALPSQGAVRQPLDQKLSWVSA